MKISQKLLLLVIISMVGLCSCSQKTTIPVQSAYLADPKLPGIDSLLSCAKIDLSFYKPGLVEFFTPTYEITETFNSFEKKNIRIKDSKLFAKQKDLILDLALLPDDAFVFPLTGAKVISPYGTRRGRNHTGIDLKTRANDTIVAAFSGIVRVSERSSGYGNVIVVRHYNGIETVYSHNTKNFVKSGDRVKAGSPIGLTGRTGRATTEHVHFEVRINGEHFDPNLLIDFSTHRLLQKCLVFTSTEKGKIQINQI